MPEFTNNDYWAMSNNDLAKHGISYVALLLCGSTVKISDEGGIISVGLSTSNRMPFPFQRQSVTGRMTAQSPSIRSDAPRRWYEERGIWGWGEESSNIQEPADARAQRIEQENRQRDAYVAAAQYQQQLASAYSLRINEVYNGYRTLDTSQFYTSLADGGTYNGTNQAS